MITRRDVRRWTKNQNSTLVGRSFDVNKEDEREQFVDWFVELVERIEEFASICPFCETPLDACEQMKGLQGSRCCYRCHHGN